eukprot:2541788-Alexandrium_andersonii.AAC.1
MASARERRRACTSRGNVREGPDMAGCALVSRSGGDWEQTWAPCSAGGDAGPSENSAGGARLRRGLLQFLSKTWGAQLPQAM